jgi:hypothetical protein
MEVHLHCFFPGRETALKIITVVIGFSLFSTEKDKACTGGNDHGRVILFTRRFFNENLAGL